MNEFVNVLTRLGIKINEKYPNINSGGCCVFASHLAELLYEKGYYVSIRIANMDNKNDNVNITNFRKNNNTLEWQNPCRVYNDSDIWFKHVLLEIENGGIRYLYDTNGFVSINYYCDILEGRLTLEEARKSADFSWNWNKTFNRQDIPEIKKIIDYYLNQLENK